MKRLRSENITLDQIQAWPPAKNLLPSYTEAQFEDLEEFLASGGTLPPIILSEKLHLIDGYNRLRMAKKLDMKTIPADVYEYTDDQEMEVHAIVLNSKRRHLNQIQVARAAARLVEIYQPPAELATEKEIEEAPEVAIAQEPEQQLLEMTTEEPAEAAEPESQAKPPAPTPAIVPDEETMKRVSNDLGISKNLVKCVQKVDSTADDELIQAMETKVLTVKQAAELAELDGEDRRQGIEDAFAKSQKSADEKLLDQLIKASEAYANKLIRAQKKLKPDYLPEESINRLKSELEFIMNEANSLYLFINPEEEKEEEEEPEF